MAFHTKRSPSQAERFLECSGTFAMADLVPADMKGGAGEAARLGTAAHALIERCLKERVEPESYRDRIIEIIEGDDGDGVTILRKNAKVPGAGRIFFIVDSEMIDNATIMTDYVRGRCKVLGCDETDLQSESRTNPLPDRDDTSGTADVTIPAWPTLLEVVDYKNGYIVVSHVENKQLLAYLLGKAIESEWAYEAYKVTVVQPNAPHKDGPVRSFEATKKELLAFQKEYRAGIEKCEEAEAAFDQSADDSARADWEAKYLHAGDHCLFCDAQAFCPARRKLAEDQAVVDFKEEPRELDFTQQAEDVARILAWAPNMEALIRAASDFALRAMESGHEIPGFKLVRGRSNRKWNDDDEKRLVKAVWKNFGIAIKEKSKLYTKPELISAPQAEKLLPSKLRKKFNELFVTKPDGNLTVAPNDDPREGVSVNPGDDFPAIEGDGTDEDEMDFG